MDIKWYLYYETVDPTVNGQMLEFSSREELNSYLIEELREATYIKVISGYTLAERDTYGDSA